MEKESAKLLLREYITTNSLINHSHMVAIAMQAYAQKQNKDEKSIHDWWLCGLLHDIDWEAYPDQHPNYAVEHILPKIEVTDEIKHAILAFLLDSRIFRNSRMVHSWLLNKMVSH